MIYKSMCFMTVTRIAGPGPGRAEISNHGSTDTMWRPLLHSSCRGSLGLFAGIWTRNPGPRGYINQPTRAAAGWNLQTSARRGHESGLTTRRRAAGRRDNHYCDAPLAVRRRLVTRIAAGTQLTAMAGPCREGTALAAACRRARRPECDRNFLSRCH